MDEQLSKLGKKHPTALIAGGASYLGVGLSRQLLAYGFKVLVLDDLSSDRGQGFKELSKEPRFKFVEADINEALPEGVAACDFVFHLARIEPHERARKDTNLSSLLTNALGTRNLLEVAKKARARFLFASAIDVYRGLGGFSYQPTYFGGATSEEEKLYSLAEAKRFAEALVWEYAKRFNLSVRIARLADIYGPEVDLSFSGTLGYLLEQLLAGEDLVVYGEGLAKEYYVYLADAVQGIVSAMFAPGTSGGIFPITPLKPITSLELAYLAKDFAPPHAKIIFNPGLRSLELAELEIPKQDQKRISWHVETSLKEGIAATIGGVREERALARLGTAPSQKKRPRKARKASPRKWLAKALPYLHSGKIPRRWSLLAASVVVSWLLFYPFISFSAFSFLGEKKLLKAEDHLLSLELEKAESAAEAAQEYYYRSGERLRDLFWFLGVVRGRDWATGEASRLRVRNYFSQAILHCARAAGPVKKVLVFSQAGVPLALPDEEISLSLGNLSQAQSMLLMGQAELEEGEDSWGQFLVRTKARVSFLKSLFESPERLRSADILEQEIRDQGWLIGLRVGDGRLTVGAFT